MGSEQKVTNKKINVLLSMLAMVAVKVHSLSSFVETMYVTEAATRRDEAPAHVPGSFSARAGATTANIGRIESNAQKILVT